MGLSAFAMGWEQATDPTSGKPYWYDSSSPDPAATTTWDQPAHPAADGSIFQAGGAQPVYQQDMSKAGGVAQPQGYPQAQPQGYPQAYPQAQPMAQGQPMMAQPMMAGQPVELHRIRVTRYRMGGMSWCLVCLLILLFWPLCWIPCVCEQCQEPYEEEIIVGPPVHGGGHPTADGAPFDHPTQHNDVTIRVRLLFVAPVLYEYLVYSYNHLTILIYNILRGLKAHRHLN